MKVYRCNHCREDIDGDMIGPLWYPEVEDDDEDDEDGEDGEPAITKAHFCSWTCLASWSMEDALEHTGEEA